MVRTITVEEVPFSLVTPERHEYGDVVACGIDGLIGRCPEDEHAIPMAFPETGANPYTRRFRSQRSHKLRCFVINRLVNEFTILHTTRESNGCGGRI